MQNVKFVFNVSESLYGPKCVCVRGRSHKRRGDDVDTSSCRDSKPTDTAREDIQPRKELQAYRQEGSRLHNSDSSGMGTKRQKRKDWHDPREHPSVSRPLITQRAVGGGGRRRSAGGRRTGGGGRAGGRASNKKNYVT